MALAEIISEIRGALGVGVEVLIDPTMLVQLLKSLYVVMRRPSSRSTRRG
jgi:hypothetical protein